MVASAHGVDWRNTGPVVEQLNHIRSIDGAEIQHAGPARLLGHGEFTKDSRALDAFLLFFPPKLVLSILSATNAQPAFSASRQPMTKDELFHFLGCMFAFSLLPDRLGNRRNFWREGAIST